MNNAMVAVTAAAIGALVGCVVSGVAAQAQSASDRISTKELLVLNERNQIAARLGTTDGNTVLQFYNEDSSMALQVGIDPKRRNQFIRFLGDQGRILAALNAVSNGDTTLYLSNGSGRSRLTLGALLSDVVTDQPTSNWGLEFRRPGASKPVFGVSVKFGQTSSQSRAAVHLIRQDGSDWKVQ